MKKWEHVLFFWYRIETRLEVLIEKVRRAFTGEQCLCSDEPAEDCPIHGLG